MLQFSNATPFAGSLTVMPNVDGIDSIIAVVKGTFTLGAEPQVAHEQVPVTPAPEFWGDPSSSSMKAVPELLLPKPGTDLLVIGSAHAPQGRPVQELVVAIQVGQVQHMARVTGDRFWRRTTAGFAMTSPEPWTLMPLTWERSYGGREETPAGWHEEPRNPVGTGFRSPDASTSVDNAPVPNVEHASLPMTSWDTRCEPVGFGPIGPGWMPRRQYAGTYDERWERERAPYLPTDFDARFFHVAPPPLIAPQPLLGGEPVALHGLSADGPLGFYLPVVPLVITVDVDGRHEEPPVRLDTVTFEPDHARFTMLWRAALAVDKKALKVRTVRASLASWS